MTKISKEKAEWILKKMYDIRHFEDEVHRIFTPVKFLDSYTYTLVKKQLQLVYVHI